MSGKRDKGAGGGNPWVSPSGPEPDQTNEPTEQLPPSPWNLEVPPPPSPWGDPPDQASDQGPGPGQGPGAGQGRGRNRGRGGAPGPGGPSGPGGAPGPATETSSAWGEKVGPPSLRRPPAAKQGPRFPPILIPIGAGLVVVVLVAVALILLSGGDDKAGPNPAPSTQSTPAAPKSSYQPPPNALAVGFGVSLVPVEGWSLVTAETKGKQVATYAPNGEPRAFYWVRQKQNVTAQAYLLGIVEGETAEEVAQLGNVRNLPCPKDVLVECVAIDYTSTTKDKSGADVKVKGTVEAYRRKDNVVTALDFRTRTDFAQKAEADAATMKKSVIDSL